MLVEVGDQTAWKVHDALLSSNEPDPDRTKEQKCETEIYSISFFYGHSTAEENRT